MVSLDDPEDARPDHSDMTTEIDCQYIIDFAA
jgi:hypothetical protein